MEIIKFEQDGTFALVIQNDHYHDPNDESIGRSAPIGSAMEFKSAEAREHYLTQIKLHRSENMVQFLESLVRELRTVEGAGRAYRQALKSKRKTDQIAAADLR